MHQPAKHLFCVSLHVKPPTFSFVDGMGSSSVPAHLSGLGRQRRDRYYHLQRQLSRVLYAVSLYIDHKL